MTHILPRGITYSFNMEEKDFTAIIKEAVLRAFYDKLKKDKEVELSEMYSAIVSGTLSAIGTIAQMDGYDPNEIVKDIVAQTYAQVCKE